MVNVSTHTLTIQNVGWRPASRIEILHGQTPQLFRFVPQVNFTQSVTPAGEHVITIYHDRVAGAAGVGRAARFDGGQLPAAPQCQECRGALDAGDDTTDLRYFEGPQAGVPGVAAPRRRDGDLLALADLHAADTLGLGPHLEVAVRGQRKFVQSVVDPEESASLW